MVANGKRRKTRIFQLEQEGDVTEGQENLKVFITKYYKDLFGSSQRNNFSLDESQINDIPQINEEENKQLIEEFTEKEVREAIFQMKHNKAPGPDGFPVEFYQAFWSLIKDDLMAMFREFHAGNLPLFNLKFGIITLIPKQKEVKQIQQYRPICMLNVSFKIFTKVLANRLTAVAEKVVRKSQTAFMPGRNILEGVVVLHETIHELHKKKKNGVILKLDFEKAYNKVNWSFVQRTLRMKGFPLIWCKWIEDIVSQGSVGIKVNDEVGQNFQTRKGLRQGDPLYPILFNLVADMLAILVSRAKNGGQFRGLVPNLVDGGLSILQYADDIVLFLEDDLEEANNLKLVLLAFEKLSGLKINFHKSELFCFGTAKDRRREYVELFGCVEGSFPFRYLGIPMHYRKLSNKHWSSIEERFQKKLSCWKGKLLSFGGRLVLINSALSSLPMFMMSFFAIPRGVRKRLDYYRSRFFWQCDEHKKKYRLAKWSILCKPRCMGRLGILDLEVQNQCLLSKWLFKLFNEDGLWQEIIKKKYIKDKCLSQIGKRPGVSHFWSGLMEVKDLLLQHGRFRVNDGHQTRFWEDVWVEQQLLKRLFPDLYRIVRKKGVSVASVVNSTPLNVSFRWGIVGDRLKEWLKLVSLVLPVNLNNDKDIFVWQIKKNGIFSTQSMYREIMKREQMPVKEVFWKAKLPLKIKIFLWYLKRGVILTMDNLIKRKWKGDPKCDFCGLNENIQHLFSIFVWLDLYGMHCLSPLTFNR